MRGSSIRPDQGKDIKHDQYHLNWTIHQLRYIMKPQQEAFWGNGTNTAYPKMGKNWSNLRISLWGDDHRRQFFALRCFTSCSRKTPRGKGTIGRPSLPAKPKVFLVKRS